MKEKLQVWIAAMALAALTATASAQSLGEYARQQRAQKAPTPAAVKEYTNDNLPTSAAIVSTASTTSSSTEPASGTKASGKEPAPEDRSKLEAEYRARVREAKEKIALLEREVQVRKDELNWRPLTAALQYDKRISEDDQKRRTETAEKEKELADARQKLEDIRDELRRKDLPRSWGD